MDSVELTTEPCHLQAQATFQVTHAPRNERPHGVGPRTSTCPPLTDWPNHILYSSLRILNTVWEKNLTGDQNHGRAARSDPPAGELRINGSRRGRGPCYYSDRLLDFRHRSGTADFAPFPLPHHLPTTTELAWAIFRYATSFPPARRPAPYPPPQFAAGCQSGRHP